MRATSDPDMPAREIRESMHGTTIVARGRALREEAALGAGRGPHGAGPKRPRNRLHEENERLYDERFR